MAREKARRKNHVVSAGYLRYFADGELVRLIEIDGGIDRNLPVRSVMKETDFSVVRFPEGYDDQAERAWSDIENRALPELRGLSLGAPLTPQQDVAIKAIAALHFARAYGAKDRFDATWEDHMGQFVQRSETDLELGRAFLEEFKRPPVQGEIRSLAGEHVERARHTNRLWVETQVEYYNKMLERLVPLRTQRGVVTGGRLHFVTSDSPFVLRKGDHVGGPGSIPFNEAEVLLMTMTKNCVVAFTTRPDEPSEMLLTPDGVRQINAHVCAAADRFVVLWPKTELKTSAPWLPGRPAQAM